MTILAELSEPMLSDLRAALGVQYLLEPPTTTTVAVTNTLTETSVYSLTIPANTLGTNRLVVMRAHGRYTNTSAGTSTLRLVTKYGSTTMLQDSSGNISSTAGDRMWAAEIHLMADGATNAQRAWAAIHLSAIDGATTGYGRWSTWANAANFGQSFLLGSDVASEDSTGDLTMDFLVKHGVADALISFDLYGGYVMAAA